jgi:uncharacterized protein (DUF2267 family)
MKPNAIERTVQKTNLWLNEICEGLHVEDERLAYHALRGVLHAIRDRLSVESAAAFGAQLPLLVRGIYYEGWHAHGKPVHARTAEAFLELVGNNLAQDAELRLEPRQAVDAVFGTLRAHADPGAVEKFYNGLPADIQTVFAPRMAAPQQ